MTQVEQRRHSSNERYPVMHSRVAPRVWPGSFDVSFAVDASENTKSRRAWCGQPSPRAFAPALASSTPTCTASSIPHTTTTLIPSIYFTPTLAPVIANPYPACTSTRYHTTPRQAPTTRRHTAVHLASVASEYLTPSPLCGSSNPSPARNEHVPHLQSLTQCLARSAQVVGRLHREPVAAPCPAAHGAGGAAAAVVDFIFGA